MIVELKANVQSQSLGDTIRIHKTVTNSVFFILLSIILYSCVVYSIALVKKMK